MDEATADETGSGGPRAAALRAAIVRGAPPAPAPLVPELLMRQATAMTDLWAMTEAALEREGVDPPYWAFAWPGGQALARLVLDRPDLVAGRRVLAVGCGGGLEAVAAARAGAATVWANDLDPTALLAAQMNAALNGVELRLAPGDALADPMPEADVVLGGDVFYERAAARRLLAWFRGRARAGALALIADAGRGFLPTEGLLAEAVHEAPTLRALEDRDSRRVVVWRVPPD